MKLWKRRIKVFDLVKAKISKILIIEAMKVFFFLFWQAELLLDKSLNLTPCIFGEFSILRRACFSKNYAILKLLHILRNFLKRMVISLRAFYIGLRSGACISYTQSDNLMVHCKELHWFLLI